MYSLTKIYFSGLGHHGILPNYLDISSPQESQHLLSLEMKDVR